jgi:DNA polymerase-1
LLSAGGTRVDDVERLLLIDGHSVAYRAFFALPVENFATSTGQPTNAVFGFTSMLINLLRDETPTRVAVAFDVSRHSFRTEEYPDYKATRSASPPEFKGQVELIKEVLDALGIVHFEKPGYEADDIIATLATRATTAGTEVLISTGDRDSLQLVNDTTTVLYPRKSMSDLARMTPAAVEEKYGVAPARYPDIAALVGETSDNLPGVPGVGPKTAAKWIGQYGGLEGIVAQVDVIPGKAGQSLRDHLDDVLRNRRLNALVRDLELPEADLTFTGSFDREAVHQVFDALEFATLRDRLFQTWGGSEPQVEETAQLDIGGAVIAGADVADWLAAHAGDTVGVHVEGSWARGTGTVHALALASAQAAAWFDVSELPAVSEQAVAAWLADESRPKVLHDAKGPLHAFAAHGWTVAGLVADTAVSAYLVKPDQRGYDLTDLSIRLLGRDLGAATDGDQLSFDVAGGADAAMARARAVLDLASVLDEQVAKAGESALLAGVELPLVGTLARMEQCGIAVDQDYLDGLEAEFAQSAAQAQHDAWAAIDGEEVNLGSPKQLQVLLFEKLGMPKTKKTKTGNTTDAEALAMLYAKTEHPFLEALLRHRDVTKLRQIVEGLRKATSDDGRIRTTYIQTNAATGRLSSTDPNLQNIPVRTASGRRIREAFVAGPDASLLMTADYSQIEMRIMAHLSGDADLIEAFNSGEDFHTVMAAKVFSRDPEDIDSQLRARIKAMNYGLAYGLSAFGLSQQLAITTGEASALMEDYFSRFGGIRDFLQGQVEEARRTGYTQTILGRRRYLPDLTSTSPQRRQIAERVALNAPIQGSAADIIKVAMLDVEQALHAEALSSRMLLQVHDELVLEVADGETEVVEALVRRCMGNAADLSVALDVSVGFGRSWHDAAH